MNPLMTEAMKKAVEKINAEGTKINRAFLLNYGLASPQIEGYHYFMDVLLPEIVHENSTIWVKSEERKRRDKFWFSGVTILRPRYYEDDGSSHDIDPKGAIRKRTTYSCDVRVDVHHNIYYYTDEKMEDEDTIFKTEQHTYRNIPLFSVPCMVRSKYCHWCDGVDVDPADIGGYFIIQGHEKR